MDKYIHKYHKYTAVLFAVDPDSHESFTLSRPVATKDVKTIRDYMMAEAGIQNLDALDTILLMENGRLFPMVTHHWTGRNGDFE